MPVESHDMSKMPPRTGIESRFGVKKVNVVFAWYAVKKTLRAQLGARSG